LPFHDGISYSVFCSVSENKQLFPLLAAHIGDAVPVTPPQKNSGLKRKKEAAYLLLPILFEISLEEALQRLAVSCLVAGHLESFASLRSRGVDGVERSFRSILVTFLLLLYSIRVRISTTIYQLSAIFHETLVLQCDILKQVSTQNAAL
jgi:hypothetical protein